MAERGRPRSFDRQAALERAMRVFWEKGYAGASMADLTAAMGINSPSLYAAFGCKEALFREAIALFAETEGTPIWGGLATAPSARAGVETVLRATAESFSRPDRPRGCLITLEVPRDGNDGKNAKNGKDGDGDSLEPELRRLRALSIDRFRECLEQGIERGELARNIDTDAIASFYVTVQQGMAIRARDGASREVLLSIAECAMRAWQAMAPPPEDADST
ncbi:TetR/AcrR family transcriptional regulator [Pendulispora albinea]|uniref:TetR/AcrR family transcriptional regulator n=1 Tax=Pendulispora albinea TaxID=2741071 RepID=A0ABZ2M923_9BACT